MGKLQSALSRIRLVYKRSRTSTKVVVLCAIVLSTVTLLSLRASLLETQARTDALRDQAAQLEQENENLSDKIGELGSVDSVEDIAKEELDLVNPDTTIFQPGN